MMESSNTASFLPVFVEPKIMLQAFFPASWWEREVDVPVRQTGKL